VTNSAVTSSYIAAEKKVTANLVTFVTNVTDSKIENKHQPAGDNENSDIEPFTPFEPAPFSQDDSPPDREELTI